MVRVNLREGHDGSAGTRLGAALMAAFGALSMPPVKVTPRDLTVTNCDRISRPRPPKAIAGVTRTGRAAASCLFSAAPFPERRP